MAYSIQGNRILPSNWKEARENRWGFKTHSKCAGGIRVCFGTAIRWEVSKGKVIYINTSSVKHWWKANSVWRKEIGFGGNFSKKKLIDLLNAKIQGRTTSDAIRRASQSLFCKCYPSQPVRRIDEEKMIKICEEIKRGLAREHADTVRTIQRLESGISKLEKKQRDDLGVLLEYLEREKPDDTVLIKAVREAINSK